MSKLGQELKLMDRRSGEHPQARYVPMKRVKLTSEWAPQSAQLTYGYSYRIGALFQARIALEDKDLIDARNERGAAHYTVQRAKAMILDEIFGEYVPPLMEAIAAIDDWEPKKAIAIIDAVIRNMRGFEPMPDMREVS